MFNFMKKKPVKVPIPKKSPMGVFSTELYDSYGETFDLSTTLSRSFQKSLPHANATVSAASDSNSNTLKPVMDVKVKQAMDSVLNTASGFNTGSIPDAQITWYANQGFIGFQMCAVLQQNWLIHKACAAPAEDSVRKGYDITINDGTEVKPEVIDAIKQADKDREINKQLIEFIEKGRTFGIRIALFKVKSNDPNYYEKPFNIDGVTPGSYQGIAQIDPYWVIPELDFVDTSNPASLNFYNPLYWSIMGMRVHRSHFIIYRHTSLPDVLKPTYFYGGISVPQFIYERVYAAERSANEAPLLLLTKRIVSMKIDVEAALTNEQQFIARMGKFTAMRNNLGVNFIGLKEEIEQFDTALSEVNDLIAGQYQLVSAAAGVPVTKLMETQPKGLSSTGEYEEASYHEMLKSLQERHLTPFLARHHAILLRSDILPKFSGEPFDVSITWTPLDELTEKEEAEVNKVKVESSVALINAGVIDGEEERKRLIADPQSGYSGLIDDVESNEQD